MVEMTWPAGNPVVTVRLERTFHQANREGRWSMEPAGLCHVVVCLSCADVLWNQWRVLVRKQEGRQ